MKTVLLSSDHKRHQYIAQCLYEQTDLQLIISEEKSARISDTSKFSQSDSVFLENHFEARKQSESHYFKDVHFPEAVLLRKLSHGAINSQSTREIIEDINPDIIVLFGTSIIDDLLLETFPGKFINLHLGLSPYFKGSATNLLPLLYKQPQCIGATIHIATRKVDAGGILHQLRPVITQKDSIHDVGNKVILKAGKELPRVLKKYSSGLLTPVEQSEKGKVCKIQDLNPEVLKKIYKYVTQGIFQEYLENKPVIDLEYPIIEQ